jgi:hypothetical protein
MKIPSPAHVRRAVLFSIISAVSLSQSAYAEQIGTVSATGTEQFKVSRCGKSGGSFNFQFILHENGNFDFLPALTNTPVTNYGTFSGALNSRKIYLTPNNQQQGLLANALGDMAGILCNGSDVSVTSYQPFNYAMKLNKRLDQAKISLKSSLTGYNYSYGTSGKGNYSIKANGSYTIANTGD